jgi:hypothetical protein
MKHTIIVFSGKEFTLKDIELIKSTRMNYTKLSRTELVATFCEFIGWTTPVGRAKMLNNSPYLIFPWVNIPNLASKALSIAVKQIQKDWLSEYCYAPMLLETFVDLSHFAVTCYKASNWTFLSENKGRGRMDRNNEKALSRKAIYMYSLQKDFKDCLKGLKPCKLVNPDE